MFWNHAQGVCAGPRLPFETAYNEPARTLRPLSAKPLAKLDARRNVDFTREANTAYRKKTYGIFKKTVHFGRMEFPLTRRLVHLHAHAVRARNNGVRPNCTQVIY